MNNLISLAIILENENMLEFIVKKILCKRNTNENAFRIDIIINSNLKNRICAVLSEYDKNSLCPFNIVEYDSKKEIDEIMKKNKYKIVHLFNGKLSFTFLKIAYKNGIPIRIMQEFKQNNKSILKNVIFRLKYKKLVTNYFVQSKELIKFNDKITYIVHNNTDFQKLYSSLRNFNKVLFLDSWDYVGNYFRKNREKNIKVDSKSLYKNSSLINKGFRFLGLNFFKPLSYFCYGDWKKNIKKYDLIIMESRRIFEYAIKYVDKRSNARIVVWYWNKVTAEEMNPLSIRKKYNCETWTFDDGDAKKYDMVFNDSYYFKVDETENKKIIRDVYYIGIDKPGRIEQLNELSKVFKDNSVDYYYNLTTNKRLKKTKDYDYKKPILYSDVLEEIAQSKVIVDLTMNEQCGLTLRPLESIFFKKKLITNNKNILNYKFYNKDNIFIVGIDDFKRIKNFINGKYKDIDNSIVEYYEFDSWLNRIINHQ